MCCVFARECGSGDKARLCSHIVSAEEIDSVQCISRDEALNLIERRKRIERTKSRLHIVGGEPYRMAVGLAGLCTARLAQIRSDAAAAEGDESADIDAHGAGKAHDDLEVGFDAGAVCGLAGELNIAV